MRADATFRGKIIPISHMEIDRYKTYKTKQHFLKFAYMNAFVQDHSQCIQYDRILAFEILTLYAFR